MNTPDTGLNATRSFWETEFHRHELLYPSEEVVRFLARSHAEDNQQRNGLDIGFGGGRHLKAMMDRGIRAHGVELFQDAVDKAKAKFDGHPCLGDLRLGDFKTAMLPSGFFDDIICWGSIFLSPPSQMASNYLVLHDLLKPGGRFCLNIRTQDNWFAGLGKEVESGYYLLDERAGPYAGALYAFYDEQAVRQQIAGSPFEIEGFERLDQWRENLSKRHSWWIVTLRRPLNGKTI